MAKKKISMNEKYIVRIAMALSNNTIKTTAEKTGIHPNVISSQLNRFESTMTLTSLFSILDAIGFEIVVRDKDKQYGGKEYVFSEISGSSVEWEKMLISEKTNAEMKRIDSLEESRKLNEEQEQAEIDRIKSENAAAMRESMK
jgi:hypothetical protein